MEPERGPAVCDDDNDEYYYEDGGRIGVEDTVSKQFLVQQEKGEEKEEEAQGGTEEEKKTSTTKKKCESESGMELLSKITMHGPQMSEPVCTLTLVHGLKVFEDDTNSPEDENARDAMRRLENGVCELVERNPLLAGRAVRVRVRKSGAVERDERSNLATKTGIGEARIAIELRRNRNDARRIKRIRLPPRKDGEPELTDEDLLAMPHDERIHFLHEHVEHLVPSLGGGVTQVQRGSTLFKVSVVAITPRTAVYCVSISHLLVDGSNYYMLVGQLAQLMKGEPVTKEMHYKTPIDESFMLYTDSMSSRDIFRCSSAALNGFAFRLVFGTEPTLPHTRFQSLIHSLTLHRAHSLTLPPPLLLLRLYVSYIQASIAGKCASHSQRTCASSTRTK